jgi:hypothetical protein
MFQSLVYIPVARVLCRKQFGHVGGVEVEVGRRGFAAFKPLGCDRTEDGTSPESPDTPLDHRFAGLIVVANHGAVMLGDVANEARDVIVRSTWFRALSVSHDIPVHVLDPTVNAATHKGVPLISRE